MIAGVSMCIKRIKGDDIFKHRLESIPNEINQLIADMGTLLDFRRMNTMRWWINVKNSSQVMVFSAFVIPS
jgi:hypothetical protein